MKRLLDGTSLFLMSGAATVNSNGEKHESGAMSRYRHR